MKIKTKEAQADAPGYAVAPDVNRSCIGCKFARYDSQCSLYDFKFQPWYTCNSFEERERRPYWEARITPRISEAEKGKEFEGKEWEVTIIGAKTTADVVKIDGKEYIKSLNGRLYAVEAIEDSVALWEGVKVYDNHLTNEEFEAKQGMRSPVVEWLGTIVSPFWDATTKALKGTFKVVEDALAKKLKNAWDSGVLNSIGLSIDTFPITGNDVMHEGKAWPVIAGFNKILSVDLVGDPAAGGGFNRLIAAMTLQEDINMKPEEIQAMIDSAVTAAIEAQKATVVETVKTTLAEALAAEVETPEVETPEVSPPVTTPDPILQEAQRQTKLATCELMLERKLGAAKLNGHEKLVREAFTGKIFDEAELDTMIKNAKEAQASADPTGRVTEGGGQRAANVQAGLNEDDKFAIEYMRLVMGNAEFNEFRRTEEHHELVQERVDESRFIEAWKKDGKPELRSFDRLSTLIKTYLGGDPLLDSRALETATTSSLATIVKNTVNIMVAADYSKKHLWYETLVRVEEVDTIDQSTLARLYGVNTLSIVSEGGPYTELVLQDEEETAAFVKKGNYVGITMETLMRDKLNYIRSIPMRMSNAWYNTLSLMTGAVFTTNSAAGPVLSDSGALFNATAATSGGGHANLLTTALSLTSYGAARTAMRKQTDQPLGAGQKLQITPAYLLVPEDLETTALQIRNSEYIPGNANNDINPHYQKFEVVVVPTWTDATDWALAANPAEYPAIWHIFPRGARTPSLFTADSEVAGAMFTNDTLRFKVRMLTYQFSATYDVAPVSDFRGLHKSNV
jgi:hypothetical protein